MLDNIIEARGNGAMGNGERVERGNDGTYKIIKALGIDLVN